MGSPQPEANHLVTEEPQHTVSISKPFYMGQHEVTQAEYEKVMGINPSHFSKSGGGSKMVIGKDTSLFPVDGVSWFDAIEFCNLLSAKENVSAYYSLTNPQREQGSVKSASVSVAGGQGFRLPTEAEWEYACRANTTTPFSFGNQNNGRDANVNGGDPYGTTDRGPSLGRTVAVGAYKENRFKLFDMHGNVWEWCEDVYNAGLYGSRSGITTDPLQTSGSGARVFRGGAWGVNSCDARSAIRNGSSPNFRDRDIGFRVAKNVNNGIALVAPVTTGTGIGEVRGVDGSKMKNAYNSLILTF